MLEGRSRPDGQGNSLANSQQNELESGGRIVRARGLLVIIGSALMLAACASLPFTTKSDETAAKTPGEPTAITMAPPRQLAPAVPPEPDDIWDRIRRGFALEMVDNPRVAAEIAFFSERQGYFDRVAERAEPYLYFIVDEIERRGMPMEIALLPIVESAYQPFAYSPGRAAGIWQFIPSTGRHFGLEQNWWYDGRRDIIASTQAALDYLEALYRRFGDWEHALAAYNAGQGNVNGTIRRNAKAGRPTDYWNLPLPRETRGYVPRLLALRQLIETPEAHGITLRPLPNKPHFEVVDIGSQIDLALAASLADLEIEELYRLNPGFNRWATNPDGPHRLLLPIDRAESFMNALSELSDADRVTWHRHQVNSGETLSHIARAYNTTVSVIQEANGIRGHNIRAGSYLIVPVARENQRHYALSASQRLQRTQSRERDGTRHEHRVQRGDTLWDLSRSYGVSVEQITAWNGMAPGDVLRPGQTLVLWLSGNQVRSAAQTSSGRIQSLYYTVRSGDSLYTIARRFNVTIADLRRWNQLPQQGYLQPGQRLEVRVDVTNQQERI